MKIKDWISTLVRWCCSKPKKKVTVVPVQPSSYGITADPLLLVLTVAAATLTATGNAPVSHTLTAGPLNLAFTVADANLTTTGSTIMPVGPMNLVFTVAPATLRANARMRVDPVNLAVTVAPATLKNNPRLVAGPLSLTFTVAASGAGSPAQYPTLRATYPAHFPAALVPGADYYVGYNPATAWKYPGIDALPAGASLNSGAHQIVVTGNDVSLDGWWLANDGGWQIVGNGFNRLTVNNLYNKVGSNNNPPFNILPNCTDFTWTNSTVDGDGKSLSSFDALLNYSGQGLVTVNRNDLPNAFSDILQFPGDTGRSVEANVTENLFRNNGAYPTVGPHPDLLQMFGASHFKLRFRNNLYVLDSATGLGSQGVFLEGGVGAVFDQVEITDNVFICPVTAGGKMSYLVILNTHMCSADPIISGNYGDIRGILTPSVPIIIATGTGPYTATPSIFGNIDLNTGAILGT